MEFTLCYWFWAELVTVIFTFFYFCFLFQLLFRWFLTLVLIIQFIISCLLRSIFILATIITWFIWRALRRVSCACAAGYWSSRCWPRDGFSLQLLFELATSACCFSCLSALSALTLLCSFRGSGSLWRILCICLFKRRCICFKVNTWLAWLRCTTPLAAISDLGSLRVYLWNYGHDYYCYRGSHYYGCLTISVLVGWRSLFWRLSLIVPWLIRLRLLLSRPSAVLTTPASALAMQATARLKITVLWFFGVAGLLLTSGLDVSF